jgi:methionine-rich copper-binding protein CopC
MRQNSVRSALRAVLLSGMIVVGISLVLRPPVASAAPLSAFVIGSDPVDGSTINAAPKMVRIFFNAPISQLSVAHVYHVEQGQLVDVGASRDHSAQSGSSTELDTSLALSSTTSASGSYEVKWIALAADDGHTSYGIIGFNVGYSSTGLVGQTVLGPSTSNDLEDIRHFDVLGMLSVFWQWLMLIALTLWGGTLLLNCFILTGQSNDQPLFVLASERARQLQELSLAGLLLAEVVTLILRTTVFMQAQQGQRLELAAVLQLIVATNYGHLWLLRVGLVCMALRLQGISGSAQRASDGLQAGEKNP